MRNACAYISKAKAQTFAHRAQFIWIALLHFKNLCEIQDDGFVCLAVSKFLLVFCLRSRIKAIRANFLLAAISVLLCLPHHHRRWRWRQHRQLSPVTWVNCIKWWMHFFSVARPVCLQCSIAALSLCQWKRKRESLPSMKKKTEKWKQNKTEEGVRKKRASIWQSYPLQLSCSTIPVMHRIVCRKRITAIRIIYSSHYSRNAFFDVVVAAVVDTTFFSSLFFARRESCYAECVCKHIRNSYG